MTLFSSQPGDDGLPGSARARVMAAVMTTTLMGVFDGTMVNIALPSMAQELQASASTAVWFANGYLLAAAMTLAIFAALAARFGYRPVFLAGLTTFIWHQQVARWRRRLSCSSACGCCRGSAVRQRSVSHPPYCAPFFRRDCWGVFSGYTPCLSLQAPHRAGAGRHDPAYLELAMAVCNKRAPRHRRLSAGGESAPAADS